MSAICLAAASAHATSLGYNTDPGGQFWDRGNANSGYAFYDNFPSTLFGNAARTAGTGITNPVFSQTKVISDASGGSLYSSFSNNVDDDNVDGEVFFGGGDAVDFILSGKLTFTIRGLVLQIKRPNSTASLHEGSVLIDPKLSINGIGSIPADIISSTSLPIGTVDSSSASGASSVTTYSWSSSLIGTTQTANNNTYSIEINGSTRNGTFESAVQRGIDGFSVDVANVVPEPASASLLATGLGFLLARRRRRLAA